MAPVKYDSDFAARVEALGSQQPTTTITTPLEYRAAADRVIGGLLSFPIPGDIVETRHVITSSDGAEIVVYHFAKANAVEQTAPQPALLYYHGGGVVACPIDPVCKPGVARLVSESGVQAFAVEYRLAPEFPHPTPVEDCYAGLKWVVDHADKLRVDAARIAVIGESGGGCLSAGVALVARDRGLSPPIAKQILICPMLDDRSTSALDLTTDRGQHLSHLASRIDVCWGALVGAENRGRPDADVSSYASPARAESLEGLPSTYIDVGSLDLFREESLEYASRLVAADVEVELHLYAGLPHIFDLIAPDIPVTVNAKENRFRAIRNM